MRTVGLAMFSMFFGAGNVIFPMMLGRTTGNQIFYALCGMFITAIIVPFTGVISMIGYGGDYRRYFSRLGKIPGMIAIVLILALIGPFGGIPRCVALSYSTLSLSIPNLSLGLYSALACCVIFVLTLKKKKIVSILGNILTPILLVWLTAIIVSGLSGDPEPSTYSTPSAFALGLKEGYNTLDLLAAFFFSTIVMSALTQTSASKSILIKGSLLAAALLGLIYCGLAYISASHAHLLDVEPDQLLGAIAQHLLGGWAGLFANVTVSLACLTTAISLASIFADILSREFFRGKVNYAVSLALTLLVTYGISYLRVTGIVRLIAPIVFYAYPILIALSLVNLFFKARLPPILAAER